MLIAPGSTSISFDILWLDDAGAAVTGKVAADFPAAKWSSGANTASTAITLSDLAAITTAHPNDNTAGGIKEREGGWYRMDGPNNMFTSAGRKTLTFAETTNKRILAPVFDVQYPQNDLRLINNTSVAGTGTRIADAFVTMFNIATPVFTVASVNQTGDSFARIGVAGVGLTNVVLPSGGLANVTTWTAAIIGNITGNLSGSIGSIATGGIAAASFAAGAIDNAAIATDAIGTAEIASTGATKIATAVWASGVRVLTSGVNIQLPANGLANITAWTVDITGNLSGSVGSVTTKTGYSLADASIVTATFGAGATIPRVTLADTATTLTNLPTAPTDWVSAASVSAAAVTKIQNGLSTGSDMFTYYMSIISSVAAVPTTITTDHGAGSYIRNTEPLDAAAVRSALGLGSANLDTQLGDIPTVAEFEARTIVAATYSTAANLATVSTAVVTTIPGLISGLNNLSSAQVTAAVPTVLQMAAQITTDHGSGSYVRNTEPSTPPSAAAISAQVASDLLSAHGSGSWTTAVGFAVPGDEMNLVIDAITSDVIADSAITDAAFATMVEDESNKFPTKPLSAIRRILEFISNAITRNRTTGAWSLRKRGNTGELVGKTQTTALPVDTTSEAS